MRKLLYALAGFVLLANQAVSVTRPIAAQAAGTPDSLGTKTNFSLQLNTQSADALQIVDQRPNYDADVLAPLRVKQAERAAAEAAAQAAATAAAKAAASRAKLVHQVSIPAVLTPGSHTDWMTAAGIASSDFGYVDYIVSHESGWGVTKSNYSGSGAYGLGQALPASKMAVYGADYLTDPITQLRWANAYAVGCYGSWAGAYSHWLSHHSW